MFTPATKKSQAASHHHRRTRFQYDDSASPTSIVPDRPSTGTPAPWSSRLSVLARIPSDNKNDKRTGNDEDQIKPVYVGEFPQLVRDAQNVLTQKPGAKMQSGGIDKASSLSWIICGNQLFVWSYLSPVVSQKCAVLDIPSSVMFDDAMKSVHGGNWIVSIVPWDVVGRSDKVLRQCDSAGVVICNRKTRAVVYWTDVYQENSNTPIVWLPTADNSMPDLTSEYDPINSIVVSAIPGTSNECIARGGSVTHFSINIFKSTSRTTENHSDQNRSTLYNHSNPVQTMRPQRDDDQKSLDDKATPNSNKETMAIRARSGDEEGKKLVEKVEVIKTRNPDTIKYIEKKMADKGIQRLERHPVDGMSLNRVPKSGRGGKFTWEGPGGCAESELDPVPAAIDRNDPNYVDEEEDVEEELKEVVVGEVEVAKVAEAKEGVSRIEIQS